MTRDKYVASLGVYKGKSRRKVCSLHFQKEITNKVGGDSSRA